MQGAIVEGLLRKIVWIVIALLFVFNFAKNGFGEEPEKLKVPSPMEIRTFAPQPNKLMVIRYANDRIFIFQIEKIIPRSDCNQIKVDDNNRVRLITQAVSQAYEYILEPAPIMVSEWVPYEK